MGCSTDTKLIWVGKRPFWRSLCVRVSSGVQFIGEGEEVPADLLTTDAIEQLIAEGKLKRVSVEASPASHSIAEPISEPMVEPSIASAKLVEVPIEIEPTPIATVKSPASQLHSIVLEQDPVEPEPLSTANVVPDTAPVRTRKPSKFRGKKGSK
jgi:hypothetical protein